jgi:Secretion system C-terminal sorting domain
MKKIAFTFLLTLAPFVFAQNHSTGVITLASNMTAKFDTNATTVTLTLTGPSDRWFALGIGVTSGFFMGDGDVVVYSSGLTDRNYIGTQAPSTTETQNWTTVSDTVDSMTMIRTVVATRALNTGDVEDYVFTNGTGTLSLAFARGNSATQSLAYHGNSGTGNRGFANATFVLSTDSFYLAGFKMYPNPADSIFAIELPQNVLSSNVEMFDIAGKTILKKTITTLDNKIDISSLVAGTYLVNVSNNEANYTTQLVVQ